MPLQSRCFSCFSWYVYRVHARITLSSDVYVTARQIWIVAVFGDLQHRIEIDSVHLGAAERKKEAVRFLVDALSMPADAQGGDLPVLNFSGSERRSSPSSLSPLAAFL